jgi:hypothetical protein
MYSLPFGRAFGTPFILYIYYNKNFSKSQVKFGRAPSSIFKDAMKAVVLSIVMKANRMNILLSENKRKK